MTCARSSSEAGVKDPSSRLGLGSSSSTCSSSTCSLKGKLEKGSIISGDWIKKSTGESEAATERICVSSGKRFKTEEEDREARK